ncbi:MAG: hypothetical protein V1790_11380 [Planctomycetota bacterium]
MTPSTAIQTPLDRPSEDFREAVHICPREGRSQSGESSLDNRQSTIDIPALELAGLKVFASRDGDRVTGRVDFPYSVAGRSSIPISYRNRQPEPGAPATGPIDEFAQTRLSLVTRWRELCAANSKASRLSLAHRVSDSAPIRCSPRSLQLWARKLDTEGPAGLCARYVPAPPAVLALAAQTASHAVLVCAWWSFRIGNADRIDTPMMHSAAALVCHPERRRGSEGPNRQSTIPLADVLAAIDCYYSWPCDRRRFPFKPFARWARYDFETWLFRACDENDYRRPALEGGFAPANDLAHVPLRSPQTIRWPDIPDPRFRKRDVSDRATRAAIRDLYHSSTPAPSNPSTSALSFERLEPSNPSTLELCNPSTPQPRNPSPLVAWLQSLDPRWRGFFLRLAKGDRQAKFELIATLSLWWDGLPGDVRREIDARIEAWSKDRSRTEVQIATRRVLSLIPRLREIRGSFTTLSAAARMVV